jgi:hypothetical protein
MMVSIPGGNGKHGAGDPAAAPVNGAGSKAGRVAGFTATVDEKKSGKEGRGWPAQGSSTAGGPGKGDGKCEHGKAASAGMLAPGHGDPLHHAGAVLHPRQSNLGRGLLPIRTPPAGPSKTAAKALPASGGGSAAAAGTIKNTPPHALRGAKSAPLDHSLAGGHVSGPVHIEMHHASGVLKPAGSANPAHEHSKTVRENPSTPSVRTPHPGHGNAPSDGIATRTLGRVSSERHTLQGISFAKALMASQGDRGKPAHLAAGFAGSNANFRPGPHFPSAGGFYGNSGLPHIAHASQWGIGSFLSKVKTPAPNASAAAAGWAYGYASPKATARGDSPSAGKKEAALHYTFGQELLSPMGRKRNFPALKYRITALPYDISRLASEYAPFSSFPVRVAARKMQEKALGRVNGRSTGYAPTLATPTGISEPGLELAPEAPSLIA